MPPLSETLRHESPKGFVAVDNPTRPPAPEQQPGSALAGNPFIRCPLPPFNATSDTLRQFNEDGKIPTRRVIPLPISTTIGGGTTNNNTTIIQQGGSSSGGSTGSLTTKTVTVNVPALGTGDVFTQIVQMAKSFQLLQVTSSNPIEVRVYGDLTTQISDSSRATDTAPAFEVTQGLTTDVVLDTAPFQWNWQNRIGANADVTQTTNMYLTFVGVSGISGATVTITFLPLES